jgi:hypothetical protein
MGSIPGSVCPAALGLCGGWSLGFPTRRHIVLQGCTLSLTISRKATLKKARKGPDPRHREWASTMKRVLCFLSFSLSHVEQNLPLAKAAWTAAYPLPSFLTTYCMTTGPLHGMPSVYTSVAETAGPEE